jgi:hypothetical protein
MYDTGHPWVIPSGRRETTVVHWMNRAADLSGGDV